MQIVELKRPINLRFEGNLNEIHDLAIEMINLEEWKESARRRMTGLRNPRGRGTWGCGTEGGSPRRE